MATCFIGVAIGSGNYIDVYLIFFAFAAFATALAMGDKYWLLIPISFSFNVPAIPFGGRAFELPELAIMLCTVVFACRYAMRSRGIAFFRPTHVAILLYTAWTFFIFRLHPVGLMVMGSSLGGARFYFKIALACAAFLIVANQAVHEKDAKWIIRLILIGSVMSLPINIPRYFTHQVYTDPNAVGDEYYSWHQELATPAYWMILWLVSRYTLREIFSLTTLHRAFFFFACVALVIVSGQRSGFASALMMPVIVALLRRQFFYLISGMIAIIFTLAVLTFGQGHLFTLPLQVQRTLSYLPGNWDSEVRSEFQTGIDPFRQEMRDLAWEKIKEHPIIGEGYALNPEEIYGIALQGDLHMFTVLSLALGSSWHNTWLGIWADFGLPPVLFWAAFWIQAVVIGLYVYRRTTQASAQRTLALMLLISFITAILRSWSSGHSSESAFTTWWMFGILVALYSQFKKAGIRAGASSHVQAPPILRNRSRAEAIQQ